MADIVPTDRMVETLQERGMIPEPEEPEPAFVPTEAKPLTTEEYKAYEEAPPEKQFEIAAEHGYVPEGAEYVAGLDVDWSKSGLSAAEIAAAETRMAGLTGRPAEGWGYLTEGQVAKREAAEVDVERRRAAREVAVTAGREMRTERFEAKVAEMPWDFQKAYEEGGAEGLRIYTDAYNESVERLNVRRAGAVADIERVAPGVITVEDGKTYLDLTAAKAAGVSESTIKTAGFVAVGAAPEVTVATGPPSIFREPVSRFGFTEEQKAYLYPRLLKEHLPTPTVVQRFLTTEEKATLAELSPAAGARYQEALFTVKVPEEQAILKDVYEKRQEWGAWKRAITPVSVAYDPVTDTYIRTTKTRAPIEAPLLGLGTFGAVAGGVTAPMWAPGVAPLLAKAALTTVKWGGLTTAVTGGGITVAGAFAPSAKDPALEKLGWYGRGLEAYWMPGMEKVREKLPGIPGQLVTGVTGYMAPHELFGRLYPERGPIAAITMVPHFGPTWGYTGLTWEEQTALGKTMGVGMGFLPYAVGPARSALGWVGTQISRVPVLGPVVKTVTAPIRWGAEVVSPVTGAIERVAPWQMAYRTGRLIPGYGGFAQARGWLGPTESYVDLMRRWGAKSVIGREVPRQVAKPVTGEQEWIRRIGALRVEKMFPGPTYPAPETRFWATGYKPIPWGGKPGIVRPAVPTGWGRFAGIMKQIPTVAPSALFTQPYIKPLMYAGAVISPIALLAAPAVTPMIMAEIPSTMVDQNVAVVDKMLEQKVITQVQHTQIVRQIQQVPTTEISQVQYEQEVQHIVEETLEPQQVTQFVEIAQEVVQPVVVQEEVVQPVVQETTIQQVVYQDIFQQQYQQQLQQFQQQIEQIQPIQPIQQVPRMEPIIQQPIIEQPITEVMPPIFPPIGGFGAARLRGRARTGRGRLLKGPLGAWAPRGFPVAAPHPMTGEMVGFRWFEEPIEYGAVKPRKPKVTRKKRRGPRLGIVGPTRITGSVGSEGRFFKPTLGV